MQKLKLSHPVEVKLSNKSPCKELQFTVKNSVTSHLVESSVYVKSYPVESSTMIEGTM